MDRESIEKVARAISKIHGLLPDTRINNYQKAWELYVNDAEAAIKAMITCGFKK